MDDNNINNQDSNLETQTQNVEQVNNQSVENVQLSQQAATNDKVEVQSISNNSVPTIDEVNIQNIVDDSTVEVPVNDVKVKEQVTYKNPSKLSTFLVILLFIGLFVFIFEMPKINEWLETRKQDNEIDQIERQAKQIEEQQKKQAEEKKKAQEEAKKKQEEEENATLTLTCKLNVPVTETITYMQDITQTFDYNKKTSKVFASTQTTKYTFTLQDDNYTNLKTKCETDANNYLGKVGYTVSCVSDDLSITTGNGFDLATYETITDGVNTVTPNATLNENIADVKTRLTTAGYICE